MKKFFIPILAAAVLCAAPACENSDIESLKDRVSQLETGRVFTVEEQISSIRITIDRLTATDSDLKAQLELLKDTQSKLDVTCGSLDKQMENLKNELESYKSGCSERESALKAELLGELGAFKQEISGTLTTVRNSIDSLGRKDREIIGMIDNLRTYVEGQRTDVENWAKTTFATLEQLSDVSKEVAGLKSTLAALDLDEVDKRLKSLYSDCESAIEKAVGALDSRLSGSINDCRKSVEDCMGALEDAKSGFSDTLSKSLEALESSLKNWVGEQLSGYCTIDQTDARLDIALDSLNRALKTQKAYCDGAVSALAMNVTEDRELLDSLKAKSDSLAARIATNETDIASLKSSLASLRSELASQYESAIQEAVSGLEGRLSGKIENIESTLSAEIGKVSSSLEGLVSRVGELEEDFIDIKGRFASIESEFESLKSRLGALLDGIRSVSFVPSYTDGRVAVNFGEGETLTSSSEEMVFKISPAEALPVLKDLYEKASDDISVFKASAVRTLTRSAAEFIDLPVGGVSFDEASATVTVTLDCSPLGVSYPANAVLKITDGTSSISSDYVPMFSADYIVRYTTSDSNPVSVIANSDKVLYNAYDKSEGGIIIFDKTYGSSEIVNYKGTFANSHISSVSVCDAALLCEGCFYSCYDLESVSLPSGITSIPALCFNACESLKDINLPDSLEEIGIQSFKGCTALSIDALPASLRVIRDFAFIDCKGLEGTLDLKNVESLGNSVFMGCSGITSVIGDNVSTIRETAFYECTKLASAYFSHLINMGRSVFNSCTALETVSLGNYITIISENAFSGCTSLKSFSVPYSVRSIENKAFYNCTSLNTLKFLSIGYVIDKIGVSAFSGCALGSIELNACTIDENAFAGNSLETVTLGSRTAFIGSGAFSGNSRAMAVTVDAMTPPQIGGDVWDKEKLTSITTPDAAAYRAAAGWNAYADKIK